MEEIQTDVLIIGSGLAGVIASLEAAQAGVNVLITSKFSIGMGTNSSLSGGFLPQRHNIFQKKIILMKH